MIHTLRRVAFVTLVFESFLPSSPAAAERLQACTITINSSDEGDVLKKYLKKDFDFVELTELSGGPATPSNPGSENSWLAAACRRGVQCDILLISGHFAGTFFGSRQLELSVDQMEAGSCNAECEGIFKRPKEVFLFGCNTLAEKEKDHRSPDEYVQVLVNDGISRVMAERIAMDRYGPLNFSNKSRMQQIFPNAPRIYGYSTVGPLGPTVKPALEQYLKQRGNYAQYLHQADMRLLTERLTAVNDGRGVPENNLLKKALSRFPLAQCSGVNDGAPQAGEMKEIICSLRSTKLPFLEKLKLTAEILKRPDALSFVGSISNFLEERDLARLSSDEKEAYRRLAKTEPFRSEVIKTLQEMKISEPMGDLVLLADNLGLLDKSEVHRIAKDVAKHAIATGDGHLLVRRFVKKNYPIRFTASELPSGWVKTRRTRDVLFILGKIDADMELELVSYFLSPESKGDQTDYLYLASGLRDLNFSNPKSIEHLILALSGSNFREVSDILKKAERTSWSLFEQTAPSVLPSLQEMIRSGSLETQDVAFRLYLSLSDGTRDRRQFLESLRNHPQYRIRSWAENALRN